MITNQDTIGCPTATFQLTPHVDRDWKGYSDSSVTVSAGQTVRLSTKFQSSALARPGNYPITILTRDTSSTLHDTNTSAAYIISAPTPTPTPIPSQSVEFRVKLTGVTGALAESAKIAVKFSLRDGSIVQLSQPLSLTHVGSGVYKATAVLTNPFPAGTGFRISIKGEKHLAVRFCRQVGQTGPCGDTEYIVVPAPIPLSYGFDLTGISLPPGDLSPQDGSVDQADINRLTALMAKLSSTLTAQDKLTGDLNYDGAINGFDLFLILQTLQVRYDGF